MRCKAQPESQKTLTSFQAHMTRPSDEEPQDESVKFMQCCNLEVQGAQVEPHPGVQFNCLARAELTSRSQLPFVDSGLLGIVVPGASPMVTKCARDSVVLSINN